MTKAISHTSPHKELPPKKTKISKASHKIKHDAEKKSKHVVSKEASLKKKSDNNQRDKLTAQKLESPVKHASRKRKMKKPKAKLKESRDSEAVETNTHTDDVSHSKLLKSIQGLDGRKAPISQRSEATLGTSEYHNRGQQSKVEFGVLLKSLDGNEGTVKNYLKKQDGSLKVAKPKETIHIQKAERLATYDETRVQVNKWQSLVEDNRVTPHQSFPLEKAKISMISAKNEAMSHEPRTAMELEIQALLKGPEFVAEQAERASRPVLTKAEERAMRAMDLAKAKEDLSLRRKHRAMVSQIASRNHRQKKIKSRGYHRHLKVARRKEAFKALEKLKSEDPEAYKERAEEIERARIEERASLRHRGKSKFAKLAKRYGKFNDKIKESLDEMRAKGVELTKKPMDESSSDEADSDSDESLVDDVDMDIHSSSDEEGNTELQREDDTHNPWMRSKLSKSIVVSQKTISTNKKLEPLLKTAAFESSDEESDVELTNMESEAPIDRYVQSNMTKGNTLQMSSRTESSKEAALAAVSEIDAEADGMMDGVTTDRIQTRDQVDRFDSQFEGSSSVAVQSKVVEWDSSSDEDEEDTKTHPANRVTDVDPTKVMRISSTDLSGQIRPVASDSEDSEGDEHKLNIAQAFADDDVVEEFSQKRKRKFEMEDEAAEAAADLGKLPGWGSWGGAGIQANKRINKNKRGQRARRALAEEKKKKADELAKRQSIYPPNVIVNEEAIKHLPITKYQVANLKKGLKKQAFAAVMAHPVGTDFIPSLAHRELCKPKVATAAGIIIDPISKDMVVEKEVNETFPLQTAKPETKIARQYELNPEALKSRKKGKLRSKKVP